MSYEDDLRKAVQDYKVCWEVLPHTAFVDGHTRQIGFDLELTGTHLPGVQAAAGCEQCRRVYSALKAIANHVLPKEQRPSRYEVSGFDNSIRYSPSHDNRPDVTLTITIGHRSGFGGVDDCEVRCLGEMKTALGNLGAQSGNWSTVATKTA
jgi:hypothetical protein